MKTLLCCLTLLLTCKGFAQSSDEAQVLSLSAQIFNWETANKIDSLQSVFHDKFFATGSDGNSQTKQQYISRLHNGDFIHTNITVEENTATVSGNTALVSGKGTFAVTISGKPAMLHLSYLEVFTRPTAGKPWQVLAMKANVLPK